MMRFFKFSAAVLVFLVISGLSGYLALTYLLHTASPVVVPHLVGKDVVYTLEILTDLGLNTKVQGSEYSETVPKHHITFQTPEAGSEIKKGRSVNLVISKGPRKIFMPNLKGLNVEQAHVILADNGLNQGYLTRTYHDQATAHAIIAQTPLTGASVMRHTPVNLLVSQGPFPHRIRMLRLQDLSTQEALAELTPHQIRVRRFNTVQRAGVTPNRVVDQMPKAGYPVSRQEGISLTINQNPAADQTTRPQFEPGQGVGLFRYRTPPGFLKRHIRVMLSGYGSLIELVDEFVKPGEQIVVLVPNGDQLTLFLHEDDVLIETHLFE